MKNQKSDRLRRKWELPERATQTKWPDIWRKRYRATIAGMTAPPMPAEEK
jgi:hypothetical protein